MIKNRFSSLNEINRNLETTTINLPLPPYIDPGQIAVNSYVLNEVTRIANIKALKINWNSEEESSDTSAVINGINSDGSASLSKISTRKTPSYQTDFESDLKNRMQPLGFRKIEANLDINRKEIINNISSKERGGLHSPEGWANQLNSTIRKGLRDITINHLIKGMTVFDYLSISYSSFIYPAFSNAERLNSPTRIFVSYPLSQLAFSYLLAKAYQLGTGVNHNHCIDLLGPHLPQVLRTARLATLLKTQKLVKPL